MKKIAIIPARYASTRFPGKPLVDMHGKSMIQMVYEKVVSMQLFDKVLVATDDERIFVHCQAIEAEVCITSSSHQSGTDRCGEVIELFSEYELVVNIQGDEPFVHFEQISSLLACFENPATEIATLVKQIRSIDELFDINIPKVVINVKGEALYFSRNTQPFLRNYPKENWLTHQTFYKHIGVYAYRNQVLKQLVQLPIGDLEKAECLEQLRWLENGFRIQTAITDMQTIAIDTPEDLHRALEFIRTKPF